MERTFLMIKPDGVQRGLIGEIIKRIESKGLKIVAMKMMRVSRELAEKHYEEHRGKPFYEGLISYITSSPVVAMVVEGKNAVQVVRKMIGATDPLEASPGTIRGDFGMEIGRNVVHAADSLKSAEREISLYFSKEEILEYRRIDEEWLYE
ncbi:MAG: nucleoside-diphosphate kinase [Archaeoglobi archaeon]|nr:nucleoside-diphosphate kinase [Archaeoglobi archaeon]MDK2782259.1 nucleoside-diphosphate kinase [Archaeoglobi archaeon]